MIAFRLNEMDYSDFKSWAGGKQDSGLEKCEYNAIQWANLLVFVFAFYKLAWETKGKWDNHQKEIQSNQSDSVCHL